jgi:hypothetical protein
MLQVVVAGNTEAGKSFVARSWNRATIALMFGEDTDRRLSAIEATLATILAQLKLLTGAIQIMSTANNALDSEIAQLTSDVTQQTSVIGSLQTFVAGIPGLIATAVADAQAAGATPTELASLTTLGNLITQNSDNITAAITTGTPVTPAQAAAVKTS